MAVQDWEEKYQKVFNAFQAVLPEAELGDIERKLRGTYSHHAVKYRDDLFALYGEPVVKKLGDDAESLLLDYFVTPKEHCLVYQDLQEQRWINKIASVLAGVYCETYPSEKTAKAISERLVNILENPRTAIEMEQPHYVSSREFKSLYHYPKAQICAKVLNRHLHIDGVQDLLLSIYQGEYNQLIDYGEDSYDRYENTNVTFLGSGWEGFTELCLGLFQRNAFEYDWFLQAVKLYPHCIYIHWLFYDEEQAEVNKEHPLYQHVEFIQTYQQYLHKALYALLEDFDANLETLKSLLDYCNARGMEWLKKGLELIVEKNLKAKDLKDGYDDLARVIRALIGIVSLGEGESETELVSMLSAFKEKELLLALPYAGCARNAILKALGWGTLVDLQKQIFTLGHQNPNTTDCLYDVANCESTTSGVIDRGLMAEILAQCDEKQVIKYLKALRASSLEVSNILMLVAAVMGIERDKIEKKLVRHGQAAIKAYGLYAIENPEELRERYLKFKTMHKEATQYGSERQANTQAAVKAGIKNLAQSAGYSDDIRLEWAMEADIAENMIAFDEDFAVENWQVRLVLEGISPKIKVSKQDKPLKSVPPKVRQSDIYKQMREAQDNIRSQASRFRKTLEDMMCNADIIEADELKTLCRLPVVRSMLSQLVLTSGKDVFGLFAGNKDYLIGIDGDKVAIAGDLKIAHVYDLFNAGLLPQWQKAVVKQRIVQPFKQAFRELYIVTPAEVNAGTHSRRFTGQVIDGAKASRLLQTRAWSQSSGDCAEVYKRFPKQKLMAEVGFPDAGHYLAEMETVTIDEIWFVRGREEVKLEDIEPLVFSEVMRDVDLLASVAQVGDDDVRWSTETAQRRAELIENLIAEIGLKQVRCEDHYAYIEGKLANYRIHLGSGVIHIQPGNYLCIVPERHQKTENLYLPFADTDLKMAEIISKIFLLISDDKITDKSILEQINAGSQL